jgi:hypothetical protein
MRKTFFIILSIIGLFIILPACDKTKTPQEYLREEKKAIDRFINREGIKVLTELPPDTLFQEKEFFKTDRGLYIHVDDAGDTGNRAGAYTEVLVRFDYHIDIKDYIGGDTIKNTLHYSYFPLSFVYGIPGSYDSYFACEGWAIPLKYVGRNAIIDLIIPSALGSQSNSQSNRAVYFENLRYTRFNQ